MIKRCPYCGTPLKGGSTVYTIVDVWNHSRFYCSEECARNGRDREVEIALRRVIQLKNQTIKKLYNIE